MAEKQYNPLTIRAIIGLGNPGFKYYKTRHSIGFQIVDCLVDAYDVSWKDTDLFQHTQIQFSGENGDVQKPVYVIKPLTFMNSSGQVLSFLLKKGISSEEILVIHDELEKPFGKFLIRWNGSARGHNGLRSIMGVMGKEFWRLCIGIGRPEDSSEVGDYVLRPFPPAQEAELGDVIDRAIALIEGK